MRRSIQCLLCALAFVGCGSEAAPTAPPAAAPAVAPAAEPAAAPTPVAAPAAAPAPTEPAAPAAPHLPGHFWRAQEWFPVPEDVDLSATPEGVQVEIDQARFGPEDEPGSARLTVYAEVALDAPAPIALLSSFGTTIQATAGEGCHLGVGLSVSPITADATSHATYALVQLCPLPELDGVVTQVSASTPGEDLGVGDTTGVFLSIQVSQALAPLMTDGGTIALDAPGVDYVLMHRADVDVPEVLRFTVPEHDAASTLASFTGGPIEIERP